MPFKTQSQRDAYEASPERKVKKAWSGKAHRQANPLKHMIYTMRKRAKERGESFDLTEQDLQPAPTHCPVFGVELKYGAGRRQPHSASVDRIDPSKGYVKGNVHIISDRANRAKNDLTLDELRRLVAFCETLK